MYYIPLGFSLLLLAATGLPLLLYMNKREIHMRRGLMFLVVFLAATVFLASYLTPYANASAANKSEVQWYISDLESRGFNVEYSAYAPFGKNSPKITLCLYQNLTETAKTIGASTVHVNGGGPTYFVFFYESWVSIWAYAEEYGCYMFSER